MYEDSIRKIWNLLIPELSDKDIPCYTDGDPQQNKHQKMQTCMCVFWAHI